MTPPLSQTAEIVDALRRMILSGEMPRAARLKEVDLATRFGVSRTPIREALLLLEKEALVTYTLNRGFGIRVFEKADVREAYEMRAMLEGMACRQVAENGLSADAQSGMQASIIAVETMLSDPKALDEPAWQRWERLNSDFHRLLLSQVGNRFFHRSVASVQNIPRVQTTIAFRNDVDLLRMYNRQHQAILDAIALRKGGKAEHLMREHVEHACEVILAQLAANPPQSKA